MSSYLRSTTPAPAGPPPPTRSGLECRSDALFQGQLRQIAQTVDRSFAVLMLAQYGACIAAALWLSPRTWTGAQSSVHFHVWAAIILGAIITSFPVAMALLCPGRAVTRHCVAAGQMLMSGLLIHVTGGRIETHFHVFGSLAFLAFYRDPAVLITASAVVGIDHLLRGVYWPQSVFGVLSPGAWRWLEHVGWVVFEDIFLIISIQQSRQMLRKSLETRAELERARRCRAGKSRQGRVYRGPFARVANAAHAVIAEPHLSRSGRGACPGGARPDPADPPQRGARGSPDRRLAGRDAHRQRQDSPDP